MIITVFGASGNIGRLLINKALNDGYKVRAYVRNPDKISLSNPNLTTIKGELNDFDKIKSAIAGSHAVISTLGPSMSFKAKGNPVLDGHINIIQAMQDEKVSRFITLATPSVKFEKDTKSVATIIPGIMARLFLPRAYKEIIKLGYEVSSSNLDWTIVRIIAPSNDNASNNIKVSFGDKKITFKISRENIASFMLDQVKDTKYIKSMPIISS